MSGIINGLRNKWLQQRAMFGKNVRILRKKRAKAKTCPKASTCL